MLALLVLGPLGARSESAYVIDRLLLGVHETKTLNSPIIKLLPSGTLLEVLERDEALARVRSPDGFEGWVDSSYLSTEEPPSLVADKLRRLIADGTREMERARQIIGELEGEVAELTGRAERAEAEIEALRSSTGSEPPPANDPVPEPETLVEIARLTEENDGLKRSLATLESELAAVSAARNEEAAAAVPEAEASWPQPATPIEPLAYLRWLLGLPWTWLVVGAALTLAFAAGVWLTDWNQRRRHGGFRV